MFKAIIFDFDGVILDSMTAKRQAALEIWPQQYKQGVLALLEELDWPPRMIAFRKILERYPALIENNIDETIAKKAEIFKKLSQERINNSKFIPGALETLQTVYKKCKLFINTATPQEFILDTIKARGLEKYFVEIYSSTQGTKSQNTKAILEKYELKKEDLLFVGDSQRDFLAAQENNIRFVGVLQEYNNFNSREDIKDKITNITQIIKII